MSPEARAILERKFGRALPDHNQKVTITVRALAVIVQAALDEKGASNIERILDNIISGKRT